MAVRTTYNASIYRSDVVYTPLLLRQFFCGTAVLHRSSTRQNLCAFFACSLLLLLWHF